MIFLRNTEVFGLILTIKSSLTCPTRYKAMDQINRNIMAFFRRVLMGTWHIEHSDLIGTFNSKL